ncbi:NAD(P)H-dependent flavin oxidoreductase [Pedobacter sp. AW1-32]|uniref:NAD(P)H-dependent flavin oxidoreductase n=1 Tax=Pedobacter sp. AW1-32 TaxID=3383026 RepID=UPI003FEE4591
MNWKTTISDQLEIDYPIIQAPMFGVGTPEMVAAANSAGALGSLPLGDLSAAQCIEKIRATKALTNRPFAANIFVNAIPEVTIELENQYENSRRYIETFAAAHNLHVQLPAFEEISITRYTDQVDALIEERCRIVSFTFGNLDEENIRKFKENDTTLIGTCTSVAEAVALEKSGIDIICVQGFEAGGHRGSFEAENIPEIGGFSLLPQIKAICKKPIVYAGGIYNAQTLGAAQILGAQAFQVGSLLLCSAESALMDFEKKRLLQAKPDEIVLSKNFSGRYARGIRNTFIDFSDKASILPYPYQNKLTAALRKQAKESLNVDFVSIWTGNSLPAFSTDSTSKILRDLIFDAGNFQN